MVQRLIMDSGEELFAPTAYRDIPVRWDANQGAQVKAPEGTATTLGALHDNDSETITGYMAGGLQRGYLWKMTEVSSNRVLRPMLQQRIGVPANDGQYNPTGRALQEVFLTHNRYLEDPEEGKQYNTPDEVTQHTKWAQLPKDYLPEPADLPGVGQDLRAERPDGGGAWWEYACVAIALYKQEGADALLSVWDGDRDESKDEIDDVIQQFHDHYVDHDVQYDDSSTRYRVMKDFGYKLAFAGPSPFTHLHQKVQLPKDGQKYVFDITGHTVKVRLKANMPARDADPMSETRVKEIYEFDSDPANWTPGTEFNKTVEYIYAK